MSGAQPVSAANALAEASAVGPGKFHNAEIDCFGHKLFIHDLIRGSLVSESLGFGPKQLEVKHRVGERYPGNNPD